MTRSSADSSSAKHSSQDPDSRSWARAPTARRPLARVKELRPNVITMDVDMPVMDGLTAVEHIMAECPTPILVLTADPRQQAPELTCRALELGALGLQVKPAIDDGLEAWNLAQGAEAAVLGARHPPPAQGPERVTPPLPDAARPPALLPSSVGVVAMAASTGGPQVLHRMLVGAARRTSRRRSSSSSTSTRPSPSRSRAGWRNSSRLKVRLAQDGELLMPGHVLIAPPGMHLVIPFRGRVALKPGVERDGHMPSATVLLESAAQGVRAARAGRACSPAWARTARRACSPSSRPAASPLAQNEESCVVFGMPGAAVARNAVDHLVHGDEVAAALMRLTRGEPLAAGR